MASSSSTFGPQWPRSNPNIATLVRSDGLRIPLHRALIPLVSMLMDLTEARGYNLVPGWCWGYANRPISGTRIASNHSRGCAVDINAPMNPYASAAWHIRNWTRRIFGLRRRTDIPQAVFELWEAHGFTLGVRYMSQPDPMHFEFTRTLSECSVITARLKAYLKHPDSALPKPAPPKPTHQEDDIMFYNDPDPQNPGTYMVSGGKVAQIMDGHDLKELQRAAREPGYVANLTDWKTAVELRKVFIE